MYFHCTCEIGATIYMSKKHFANNPVAITKFFHLFFKIPKPRGLFVTENILMASNVGSRADCLESVSNVPVAVFEKETGLQLRIYQGGLQ